MTTTTGKNRSPKKTSRKTRDNRVAKKDSALFPPSAEIVKLSGREYLIVPMEDFQDWDDDRMLAALMAERLASNEELIPLEEVEKRLDAKKKRRS